MARIKVKNKIESVKPPIKYAGGKQRMAHNIIPLIPKHTVYVEPFVGGAAILFMKPYPKITNQDNYREVINDVDQRLVNFYRVLQKQPEELIQRLELTLYSKLEYRRAQHILKNSKMFCALDRAWAYYVCIHQGFAGTQKFTGWGFGNYGPNLAKTFITKIENLNEIVERFRMVFVEYDHAFNCIKKWDSPHTCFYCDPPYPETDQRYTNKFSIKDFQMLVKILDNCEGSFLLSCYENSKFDIPNNWERFAFRSFVTASGQGKTKSSTSKDLGNRERTEILYRRFNRVPVRKEIQKMYDSGKYDCFVTKKD